MNMYLLIILLIGLILFSCVGSQTTSVHSVLAYGAAGDGSTDDTEAFLHTWEAMCQSSADSPPTMVIPSDRTFLIHSVVFNGPCKSSLVYFQISGEITGPENPNDWKCDPRSCEAWILFNGITGMELFGGGTINGQGGQWWNSQRRFRPTAMQIQGSRDVNITDLNFKDNPKMHLTLSKSETINVKNIIISAPEKSPNTDGIHVTGSTNVAIADCTIGTGDDCISIVNGSSYVKARNISCGPGHGISIGSLGEHGSYDTVEHVEIRDVVLTNTENGARIKTWQGGKGYARDIIFDGVVSNGAANPIIIDQHYCDHGECQTQGSGVQIQDVTFRNITGTSRSAVAVKFACSANFPCQNIVVEDIYILSVDGEENTRSSCSNVRGTIGGRQVPSLSCLIQNVEHIVRGL